METTTRVKPVHEMSLPELELFAEIPPVEYEEALSEYIPKPVIQLIFSYVGILATGDRSLSLLLKGYLDNRECEVSAEKIHFLAKIAIFPCAALAKLGSSFSTRFQEEPCERILEIACPIFSYMKTVGIAKRDAKMLVFYHHLKEEIKDQSLDEKLDHLWGNYVDTEDTSGIETWTNVVAGKIMIELIEDLDLQAMERALEQEVLTGKRPKELLFLGNKALEDIIRGLEQPGSPHTFRQISEELDHPVSKKPLLTSLDVTQDQIQEYQTKLGLLIELLIKYDRKMKLQQLKVDLSKPLIEDPGRLDTLNNRQIFLIFELHKKMMNALQGNI